MCLKINPAGTEACSFRNQPAIQTLVLITSQQMRDPKSHKILKVSQSTNLLCQDLQCYFLFNLYSNLQPWLGAASASSVPSRLGVEEKNTKSHTDLGLKIYPATCGLQNYTPRCLSPYPQNQEEITYPSWLLWRFMRASHVEVVSTKSSFKI